MATINFAGLASGIDSTSLIQATSDATRRARVTPLETRKTELEDTNAALDELKQRLTKLNDKISVFDTLNGGGIFKQAISTDETTVTASASNAALPGSYALNVTALAKNGTFSFDGNYSSSSDALLGTINDLETESERTVTVKIGTGSNQETVSVVLTSTTTISDFVNSFNSNSVTAEASLVNTGTTTNPNYRIVINSNNSGLDKGTISMADGDQGSEVLAWVQDRTESQALDASFSISGIDGSFTRDSNTISDAITGVNLQLQNSGTATVTVAPDTTSTISKIKEFVEAYNDVIEYVNENDIVTQEQEGDETTNIFGPLAGTSSDNAAIQAIKAAISGTSYSSGSTVKIFADLGITTNQQNGTLEIKQDSVLENAISSEPRSVEALLRSFADTMSLTGGTIDSFTRFNGQLDISINSNKSLIDSLTKDISEAEDFITQQEETMRQRFAALEAAISKLQSQQSQLLSVLQQQS